MKRLIISFLLTGFITSLGAQNLTISGVDSSSLMKNQKVDLYLSLTDSSGYPLSMDERQEIQVYESPDGVHFEEVEDKVIENDANLKQGIQFLMLMDNSGSMYYDRQGRATEDPARMRITHARSAMNDFLLSIEDSRDKIALASFNTRFNLLIPGTSKLNEVTDAFEQVEEPQEKDAYTELYAALSESALVFNDASEGRKVIVVLSDGENYSYYQHKGEVHPEYGEKLFQPDEAIEAMQRQGISLFAINYGQGVDPQLGRMVAETGGRMFDASSPDELAGVYNFIRQSLLQELHIQYRAGMYQSDRVWVKVSVPGDESLQRFYYNSSLFGSGPSLESWMLVLILLAAILLWLVLMFIRLEKQRKLPSLELVGGGLHQKVLDLTKDRTVIGGSASHDVTIAGAPENSNSEAATIIYDKKDNSYTLIAQEETMVNNQTVSKKKLQTGDVIKVGDDLIIFDGDATKLQE